MAAANAAGEAARAATRQAKVAEDTLVKRERPYIFIYNVSALLEDTETNEFYVSYSVSNFGNIPAIIEGAWIGFEFSNAGAPPSPPLQRLRRLEKQLALIVPEWSMAPVVEAYQAMRGASFLVAVTFAAEIGDVRRFDTPRQLMSFLGLVPAESSTGDTIRRKGLTLAGNRRARRALIEAAWTYRYPARVSETLRARLEGLPKPVRDIAWKAQVRLCARYRRLNATGKKLPIVVAAIALEMAAFLWAIGREVAPE